MDCLFAGLEAALQFVFEGSAQEMPTLSFHGLDAEINDMDPGQWQVPDSMG